MRIRIVDAFTDRPFAGNQAGVVLLDADGFPPDDRLQRLAGEVNLSETAYAHPLPEGAEADWALRWFTPTTEVALCGHATLATAHVLATAGLARPTTRFATLSGVLTATVDDTTGGLTLDFPTAQLHPVDPPPALAPALGATATATYHTGPLGDLVAVLSDEAAVRALTPDLSALTHLAQQGVIVTAAAEPGAGYDFVSRVFAPAVGIPEDPVTGSAHTALAPLWSQRLGRDELTGLQVSARTGRVRTTLRGERTLLTGTAVTVIDGQVLVDL